MKKISISTYQSMLAMLYTQFELTCTNAIQARINFDENITQVTISTGLMSIVTNRYENQFDVPDDLSLRLFSEIILSNFQTIANKAIEAEINHQTLPYIDFLKETSRAKIEELNHLGETTYSQLFKIKSLNTKQSNKKTTIS